MSKILYFVITLLFLAFGLVLGIFNPHEVDLDLILLQIQLPLSVLIALSILFGIIITVFFLASKIIQLSWRIKRLTKENTKQINKTLELNSQLIELKHNQAEAASLTKPVQTALTQSSQPNKD
jgi:putative membrane protein